MKGFLLYTLKLFVLLIVLLYACDFLYTTIYHKSKPRNKLQYILKTQNQNFDIVFLGSSRVANHIDSKLFDSLSGKKTINLGVLGAGLNDNLLQLKLLIVSNKVSNVFLQLDNNFEQTYPTTMATAGAMPFLKNKIIADHLAMYLNSFNLESEFPFYRYAVNDHKIGFREVFFTLINKKPRIDPSVGYTPKYGNVTTRIGRLPMKIAVENLILNEIVLLCEVNKINLILFTAPYGSKIGNIEYIDKLKIKFPELMDFSRGYSDELFYNYGHLNNKGAELFTKDLYHKSLNKF